MRKILICTFFAIFMNILSGYASEISALQICADTVMLCGTANPSDEISVNILPENIELQNLEHGKDLLYHDQIKADSSGIFSLNAQLPGIGGYTAYVKAGNGEIEKIPIIIEEKSFSDKLDIVQFDENTVDVKGNCAAGTTVSVTVAEKNSGEIVCIDQTTADGFGKFIFNVQPPRTGEYTVCAKIGSSAVEKEDFIFVSSGIIDNPVYFEADFEKPLEDYGFEFRGRGSTYEIVHHDEQHGNSLLLRQNGDASYLLKNLDKAVKDCTAVIEFSFLKETDDNDLLYVRLGTDKVDSYDELLSGSRYIRETFFTIGTRASFYYNMTGWERPKDDSDYAAFELSTWNDVRIILDYEHSEVSYYINNRLIKTTYINNQLFSVRNIAIVPYTNCGDILIDNISIKKLTRGETSGIPEGSMPEKLWNYSNRPVDIDTYSGKTGNIFENGETPSWNVRIKDRNGVSGNYVLNISASDETGNAVWNGSENISLMPYKSADIKISVPVESFGIYKLNFSVNDGTDEIYSRFEEFSLVNIPAGGTVSDRYGFQLHIGHNRPYNTVLPLLEKSGARLVRDELAWDYVENPVGEWHFGEERVAYWRELNRRGISLIFTLTYGRPVGVNGEWGSDEYAERYGIWAAMMARKFKELGLDFAIETYNEWNNSDSKTPEQYAKILKAAYEGVKSVDKNITVIGGDLAGITLDKTKAFIDALDGKRYMDVFSIHLYDGGGGPELGVTKRWTESLRELLDMYPEYKDVPLLMSEAGWSTRDGSGISDRRQAALLARLFTFNDEKNYFTKISWYDFQNDGHYKSEREHNFGVVKFFWPSWDNPTAYAARPSFLSYTNFVCQTGKALFISEVNAGDGVYGYKYEKSNGNTLYILNTYNDDEKPAQLTFEKGTKAIVYDMYGNGESITLNDGVYSTTATLEPIYLEIINNNNIGEVTITEAGGNVTANADVSAGTGMTLFLARYENGRLTDISSVKKETYGNQNLSVSIDSVSGEFKAFLMTENMQPLGYAEIIK